METKGEEKGGIVKVLFASYHCCIRVIKEGTALSMLGHQLMYLQCTVANDDALNMLGNASFFGSKEIYALKIGMLAPSCDVIHCHNEPDWLVSIAKEVAPNKPIVYDCHDLQSMRSGQATMDEILAMDKADGFIFPSYAYQKGATAYHRLPESKPNEVIYSACTTQMLLKQPLPRLGGIAYEGGAVARPVDGITPIGPNWPEYRDYTNITAQLTALGVPFCMYGLRQEFQPQYSNAGAVVFPALYYLQLIRQLSRHDWGYVGCPVVHPQWMMAMPNKLFDSMAAGIPVIVHNAKECAEFVQKNGIGVVVKDAKGIKEAYDNHALRDECRENVLKLRNQFVMENQVDRIEALYRRVMGAH